MKPSSIRRLQTHDYEQRCFLTLDLESAFNHIDLSCFLLEIRRVRPGFARYCDLCYSHDSFVQFGPSDPLGPPSVLEEPFSGRTLAETTSTPLDTLPGHRSDRRPSGMEGPIRHMLLSGAALAPPDFCLQTRKSWAVPQDSSPNSSALRLPPQPFILLRFCLGWCQISYHAHDASRQPPPLCSTGAGLPQEVSWWSITKKAWLRAQGPLKIGGFCI